MKREKQISYNRPAIELVLPESPELERAILGALILEPESTIRRDGDHRNFGLS